MTEAWLTKPEVARKLRVSVRTVERMRLPSMRVGGQNRYSMSQVYATINGVPEKGGNVIPLRPRREVEAA